MVRLSISALLLVVPLVQAGNWPGWRGPTGLGQSSETDLPLTWSDREHLRWKAPLPDTGNASPVAWGDSIFLTQATDKGKKRGILCIDRKTGKERWSHYVSQAKMEPTHATNPYCSTTCVTDGERVIASLGSAGILCLDFAGRELWHKDLGDFIHIWGTGSSPVLHGDLCYLWCGPGERQFLIAFNKKTGDKVWRHDEPGGQSGLNKTPWVGSWSTPVIAKIGDHEELILSIPKKVKALDPKTGKELWSCDGLTDLIYTSPVVSRDGIVIAMSGYGGSALAVKAGGHGDVTKTRRLWHHPRNPQRIGSCVIVGDYAYHVNEPGLASCFDVKTGKDLWKQERLTTQTWGSMVRAGDRLYITNTGGETLVIKPDPIKLEVLATNKLPDKVLASIAISNGDLLIRGYKFLWCISK